uniref:Uncharacterized protein n=1 Tax=Romanomermis culicivorax TaxID=13658 RepID=A0A915INQ9_ROMCU
MYTGVEVRKFRESGHTDDQIKRLGGRTLARKANRAKKREGEDVVEISDDEGEKTGSTASADSKFVGSTTLLTDSTKSRMKTTPTSQTPGATNSRSQVQSTVATAKVPRPEKDEDVINFTDLYCMGHCGEQPTIEEAHLW